MKDEYYILEFDNITTGLTGCRYVNIDGYCYGGGPERFYSFEEAKRQANKLFLTSGVTRVVIRKITDQEVEVVHPPKDPVLDKAISSVQEVLATLTEEQKKELWERLNK